MARAMEVHHGLKMFLPIEDGEARYVTILDY